MKASRFWSVLAAAAIAVMPVAAQGHGRPEPGPLGPGFVAHLTEELDLTADQQTQVSGIVAKYTAGPLGDPMKAIGPVRDALRDTIHDPDASDLQVADAAAKVAVVEAQLATEHHHMAIEINALLTPDQRKAAAQLIRRHEERMGGHPHHGYPGGH